ncbi:MAG: tyrosine--tRNA ligase, partial [Cardiobacterium sp.]
NPRDVKFELARELVARFHDEAAAAAAQEAFVNRFAKNEIPEDLEEFRIDAPDGALGIAHVLKAAGLVASTSEGLRMVDGGAVKVDGERVASRDFKLARGFSGIVQAGKRRIVKVVLV